MPSAERAARLSLRLHESERIIGQPPPSHILSRWLSAAPRNTGQREVIFNARRLPREQPYHRLERGTRYAPTSLRKNMNENYCFTTPPGQAASTATDILQARHI